MQPTTSKRPRTAAFSLVEMMVALTLVTIVLAALFSSWGFVGRSTLAMTQYIEMNTIGRTGLEIFARDLRRARDINDGFGSTDFTLVMEKADDGTPTSTVRYSYNQQTAQLRRLDVEQEEEITLFRDVEWVEFSFFMMDPDTGLAEAALNAMETRLIQLELRMARHVQSRDATKKIVSARYIMRNKSPGD